VLTLRRVRGGSGGRGGGGRRRRAAAGSANIQPYVTRLRSGRGRVGLKASRRDPWRGWRLAHPKFGLIPLRREGATRSRVRACGVAARSAGTGAAPAASATHAGRSRQRDSRGGRRGRRVPQHRYRHLRRRRERGGHGQQTFSIGVSSSEESIGVSSTDSPLPRPSWPPRPSATAGSTRAVRPTWIPPAASPPRHKPKTSTPSSISPAPRSCQPAFDICQAKARWASRSRMPAPAAARS